ncbi:MAG TPA: hypothetical protein ENI68_09975 [Gammaproteobacteria bacterium]|nr:hypothetical protein [Gammaproteobacteria bacterium]
MPYNEQKFMWMQEKSKTLHAGLLKISDRRRNVQGRCRTLNDEADQWRFEVGNKPLPQGLELALREAENELKQLLESEQRAQDAWHEGSAIVAKCVDFLRDHGVAVPTVRNYSIDGAGVAR